MRYEIVLAPEAVVDLRSLPAAARAEVKPALETHLRNEPTKLSRSRIKRLRGISRPQYRLRVDEIRVFYVSIVNASGVWPNISLNPDASSAALARRPLGAG